MPDVIANATNGAAMLNAAQAAGIVRAAKLIMTGRWDDYIGCWSIADIGAVSGRSGYWVRVRWNAPTGTRFDNFLAALRANGVTIYERRADGTWSHDGTTLAPAGTEDIALIL